MDYDFQLGKGQVLANLQMTCVIQDVQGRGRVMQASGGWEKNVQDFLLVGFETLRNDFHLDLLILQCSHCKNLTDSRQQEVLLPRMLVD